ncbi:MAG: right-handed parallel beta-helix repeat-containing protein [Planctomycetes bacterium]|nr:right-handed parallel beta-helix repeat-containing protein [Planctomycetota bacterium]
MSLSIRRWTIASVLSLAATAHAVDLHVPAEYPTIQAAIDAAVDGDRVRIAPGTYFENVSFLGKEIVVESTDGPEVTIIDGSFLSSVVEMLDVDLSTSTLRGLTITHGRGFGPAPDITWGGGVVAEGGTITRCIIVDNEATVGGGITIYAAAVVGNIIEGNRSDNGGGVNVDSGTGAVIEGNVIRNNWSGYFGDMFEGNGGGLTVYLSDDIVVRNNLFVDNLATGALFGPNGGIGGGVFIEGSSFLDFSHNTIVGNSATQAGGGLRSASSTFTVSNSICWDNDAPLLPEIGASSPQPFVRYSIVQGGYAGSSEFVSSNDPLFVAGPFGDHYLAQVATGDPADSPAVDGGDPVLLPPDGTTRTDGALDGGVPDMGFHFPVPAFFRRGDANGDAVLDIADAVSQLTGLFVSADTFSCIDAADTNDDGAFDISDPIYLLTSLFGMGAPPPPPVDCGADPTLDTLSCGGSPACP